MTWFAPAVAQAHFKLLNPPQWIMQDNLGGPQKAAPCGVEAGVASTPTNIVTPYAPGQKVTVTWQETVVHDGWFRIALSYNNRADFVDPPYAVSAGGMSTDAGIESPPVPPVLADDLFPHTKANTQPNKMYSYDLTLPLTPCTKCTLQVIQVMLNHPLNQMGGFTYHHCADISIQSSDGGALGDSGVQANDGGSGSSASSSSSGSNGSSGSSGSSGPGGSNGSSGSSGSLGSSGSSGSTGSNGSSGSGIVGGSSGNGDEGGVVDSGSPPSGGGSSSSSGCACAVGDRRAPLGAGLGSLLTLAMLLRRRRRLSSAATR